MAEETPTVGDNSGVRPNVIRSYVERIERLEEEKKAIADDIKDVFAEAKGVGLDAKVMRQVVRRRKMDKDARADLDAMLDLYESALNVFA